MKAFEPKPKDNKSVSVNFRIPKSIDDLLQAIAEKKDLNKAELIRQMIDHCLAEYLKDNQK